MLDRSQGLALAYLAFMPGTVLVALIAAVGAIIVAFINYLVSRTQARDIRARLQKDVEVLAKLENGSIEFEWMEDTYSGL